MASVNRATPATLMKKTRLALPIFLSSFLFFGCVQLEHTSDLRNGKTVLIRSVFDNTPNAPAERSRIDERNLFSGAFANRLSDRGFLLVYESNQKLLPLTATDFAQIHAGVIPQSIRSQPYDYSINSAIESASLTLLLLPLPDIGKKIHLSVWLADNKTGQVLWSTTVQDTEGSLHGFLIAPFFKDFHRNNSLNRAIINAMQECPLLR